jgi:hypothetical protein
LRRLLAGTDKIKKVVNIGTWYYTIFSGTKGEKLKL